MKRISFIVSLFLVVALGGIVASATAEKPILVGSKGFTEQLILGKMLAILIEKSAGIKAEHKMMGGTLVNHTALVNGEIDMYVEYTGTGLVTILKKKAVTDPEEAYRIVKEDYAKQWNIRWLKPLGLNNTYALAVRKKMAEELNLKTISDLRLHAGRLVLGSTHEFLARPDGYPGLSKAYELKFKEARGLDPGLMYTAVAEGQVDVISAFATDGRIPAFSLVLLKDDQRFFPPYHAAPVVREETLKKYPVLEEVLNKLAGRISDEIMADMNSQVDIKKREPGEVAEEFLKKQGLI